jgi:hypothetical protein
MKQAFSDANIGRVQSVAAMALENEVNLVLFSNIY